MGLQEAVMAALAPVDGHMVWGNEWSPERLAVRRGL